MKRFDLLPGVDADPAWVEPAAGLKQRSLPGGLRRAASASSMGINPARRLAPEQNEQTRQDVPKRTGQVSRLFQPGTRVPRRRLRGCQRREQSEAKGDHYYWPNSTWELDHDNLLGLGVPAAASSGRPGVPPSP